MSVISVPDWWDVFTFEDYPAFITCPDCDERSPELDDIVQAAKWVRDHVGRCPA